MTNKDEKTDIIKSDNAKSANVESVDTKSTNAKSDNVKSDNVKSNNAPDKISTKKYGIFSGLVNFINSVIGELKQVTTPTKDQLGEYIIVVLVFVLVIMLFITGIDMAIGQLIMWLFAK